MTWQQYLTWQQYQNLVLQLYKEAQGIGIVRGNVKIPDKLTGQLRQVDCWLEVSIKGHHTVSILIDAKYHKNKINVNHVEGVSELAKSVGANKAIIVCSNGWTNPAAIKAKFMGMDLRLWSAEDAVKFMEPDCWKVCPVCDNGLIIMDSSGFTQLHDGLILWWLAGQCNDCQGGVVWCQDCGRELAVPYNKTQWCDCGHMWRFGKSGVQLYPQSR